MSREEVPKGYVLVTLYPEKKRVLVKAGRAQGSVEWPDPDEEHNRRRKASK